MTTARTVEALLAHRDWVRSLARTLVADPARADDVAQQTMLEAIERPPRDASRPRGWLRSVARNAARALVRQEHRRERREQAVARPEAVDADAADTAHRAAMHKRLVDELFALEEPYHTVVLLRFFDDASARQIAARLQRPLATVRTQLQRGLDRMRERLDREFGDRKAWCTALLPLCAARPGVVGVPVLLTLGALAMWKWIVVAVALCALLLVTFDPFSILRPPAPDVGSGQAMRTAQASPADAGEQPARTEVAAAPAAPVTAAPAAGGNGLRGRVITVAGTPVPGLTLAWRDPELPRLEGRVLHMGNSSTNLDQPGLRELLASEQGIRAFAAGPHADVVVKLLRGEPIDLPRAVTDGSGRFELAGVADADRLVIEGSDWIRYGIGQERGSTDLVLVVGPGVRIAGRVVDEQGIGIPGVLVTLGFSLDSLPGFTQQLESRVYQTWNDNSGSDGEFELGVVPQHPALEVLVQKRGYESPRIRATEVTSPVVWTMRRAAPARFVLTGMVRRRGGAAAAGAVVTFGQDGGTADARGQFQFELTYFQDDTRLLAWLPGLQPVAIEGLGARLRQDAAAGRDLDLVLGDAALAISGRVLDAGGAGRAGITVVLVDGVVYGSSYQFLESVIGGQGQVQTGADGAFTLKGLAARDYTVRAIDPGSLLVVESGPVTAGTTGLTLRAGANAFLERLEGVLVDRHGLPVAGAVIRLTTNLQAGPHGFTVLQRPGTATTDGDGRFVIENCPRLHVTLSIGGTDVVGASADVPTDGRPLRVQVARRLRFTTSVSGPAGDRFAVLDSAGARLASKARLPGLDSTEFVHTLRRENAPVYEVDDRAAALLLLDGEREVRRIPLSLRVGEVNRVDL